MNDRFITPAFGSVIGVISFQTIENMLLTLLVAFLSGAMAWFAKFICNAIYEKFKSRKKVDN